MGFLWGRFDALKRLPTFREDFIPDEPPYKIEAGTFIYENVAGMDAAVGYLEAARPAMSRRPTSQSRRDNLVCGDGARSAPTRPVWRAAMLAVLKAAAPSSTASPTSARLGERVPTFCFNIPGVPPQAIAEAMADAPDRHPRRPHVCAAADERGLG